MFTLASVASSLLQKLQAKTPILLVTDIGSDPDDILALLVLLASDLLKVEAIVTTGGDTLNRARVAARSFCHFVVLIIFVQVQINRKESRWLQVTGTRQEPPIVPDRCKPLVGFCIFVLTISRIVPDRFVFICP